MEKKEILIPEGNKITIPEGFDVKIQGDKIFFIKKESEDEKIRKELIDILKKSYEFGGFTLNNKKDLDRYLSYFEEQRCKERYDRMAPIYENEESFESALDKAWKFYNESASATVDGFEDNAFELAFAKGFREGFLCKESQKEQKSMRENGLLSLNIKTLEYIYNVCKGCMKQMSKEEFVKCVMSAIPKELVLEKAQKPEGQHYIKRNELFEKWVQSCDPEIMKKVSDEIDEILKKGPESTFSKSEIGFADTYSKGVWEKLMLQFKNTEGHYIGCNDVSDIVLNAILDTFKWEKSRRNVAEWSEADECKLNGILADYKSMNATYRHWLKSLPERFNLPLKQEWNEGDDACYETIKGILEDNLTEEDKPEYVLSWFKSHYLHHHWESGKEQVWSKEDEEKIDDIIRIICTARECSRIASIGEEKGDNSDFYNKLVLFLKSLRPQPITYALDTPLGFDKDMNPIYFPTQINDWKPSEEQMKALGIALRCGIQLGTWEEDALKSLYDKLKEIL